MLELTEKRLVALLWILKNKEKKWSVYELGKGAAKMLGIDHAIYTQKKPAPITNIDSALALTYRPTLTFVKELEKNGFVAKDPKTNEYGVSRATDLVRLISLARPVRSMKTIGYHSDLDFTKKLGLIDKAKIPYSFTVFAGSELYRQYVKTEEIHAYLKESDVGKWEKYLISKKCLKAEKKQANLFLLPTKNPALFNASQKSRGFSVVPMPILLADLLSYGGLAQEQGEFLLEQWVGNRL